MKTAKRLWPQVVSFPNLLLAATKAQRELIDGSYRPGPYRAFYIHEPKKRLISAAPYRDRVVHHALCNVLEPVLAPSRKERQEQPQQRRGFIFAARHGGQAWRLGARMGAEEEWE